MMALTPPNATPPKTFGRLASKRFVQSVFGSPSSRELEWTGARDLVRDQRRESLKVPLSLRNGDIFGLMLRFLREMEFTTRETAVSFRTRVFSGKAFVRWAMDQEFRGQAFRDEADAVFFGNELLMRGIIAPIFKGEETGEKKKGIPVIGLQIPGVPTVGGIPGVGKGWKMFNGGEQWLYTVKTHERSALIAACFRNSTGEEKSGIRDCVGRLRTLKYLIDGDEQPRAEDGSDVEAQTPVIAEEGSEDNECHVHPLLLPFTRMHEAMEAFFETLAPHVALAMASMLFMVKLQNLAFACVLAVTFMRHLCWVSERQVNKLLHRSKADMLRKFQRIRGDPAVNKYGAESADWWSAVFQHTWAGWLGVWLNRVMRDLLQWTFASLEVPFFSKIELSHFTFGSVGPIIKSARTFAGVDDEMIVEWDLSWVTENSSFFVSAMFGRGTVVPIPIRMRMTDVRLEGKLRLTFTWMRETGGPYVRALRVSFVGLPDYDFAIKVFGGINVSEISVIDAAIHRAVDEYFKTSLCEPEAYFWDVKEWWNSGSTEEVINPLDLIDQALMKDVERLWKRCRFDTTVEMRVMPGFVELDTSGKNSSVKDKFLDGNKCRMSVMMEYGRKRLVSKSHSMKKHLEAENRDTLLPTWEGNAFAKLDVNDDIVSDEVHFTVLSERVGGNTAKRATTKLLRISRKVIAIGKIDDVLKLKTGTIHDMAIPLLDASTLKSVGKLHVRIRVNIMKPDIVVNEEGRRASLKKLGQRVNTMYSTTLTDAAKFATGTSKKIASTTTWAFTCFGCIKRDRGESRVESAESSAGPSSSRVTVEDSDDDEGFSFPKNPVTSTNASPVRPFGRQAWKSSPQLVEHPGVEIDSDSDAEKPRAGDPFYEHI